MHETSGQGLLIPPLNSSTRMQAFGDVSGHFKSLIDGHCEVAVVGVVVGDQIAAGRCAKQIVRDVQDIKEAKWNDLTAVQKRRVVECLADSDRLQFGYATFTSDDFHTLRDHYLLHQDVCFPPDWDLALTGYAYGEVLFEHGAPDESRVVFEFDRVASRPQSEAIADHIETFVPDVNPFIAGSHDSAGIQSADCLAGAVAEDYKSDTD